MRKKQLPPPLPRQEGLQLPRFSRGWRLVVFPFVLLQPGPGFALGLLYAAQGDAEARRFGRICLFLALAGFGVRLLSGHEFKALDHGESFLQPYY